MIQELISLKFLGVKIQLSGVFREGLLNLFGIKMWTAILKKHGEHLLQVPV